MKADDKRTSLSSTFIQKLVFAPCWKDYLFVFLTQVQVSWDTNLIVNTTKKT